MDFIPQDLQRYIGEHTLEEPDLLKKINRETHAQVLKSRMLSGHVQGRFLSMISKMVRPKGILEIGTYTGYSALCLAEGLVPGGKLVTIDINEELEDRVRHYFMLSPVAHQIDYRVGDARIIIPSLSETFALVFIDADKEKEESSWQTMCFGAEKWFNRNLTKTPRPFWISIPGYNRIRASKTY